MKKIIGCLIAILIFSACMISCFAESPVVSVGTSNTSASVGDTVTVYVSLSKNSNLTMLKFTVNYPTTHFEYVSGSLRSGKTFDIEETDSSSGVITFFGTSYEPVVSGGTVMSMSFKVKQSGGTISIGSLSSDGTEAPVSSSLTFKDCAHANMTWETVKASTCKEQGIKKGTCPCGVTKEEPLPLGEHKFGTPVVTKQPTCTETGTQVAKCTLCNADGTPESIPAKGHQFDDSAIKQQPTCTATGTAVGKCNACGFESTTPVTIPAKGHNFGNWVVTREPNQLMSGEQRRVCNTCQYIETQTIDRLSTTPDEPITNPITPPAQQITPIEPNTNPTINNNNNLKPNDNNNDDDKNGLSGLFGDEVSNSDKAMVLIIVLAVVTVVTLTIYILLLQQRKKKE